MVLGHPECVVAALILRCRGRYHTREVETFGAPCDGVSVPVIPARLFLDLVDRGRPATQIAPVDASRLGAWLLEDIIGLKAQISSARAEESATDMVKRGDGKLRLPRLGQRSRSAPCWSTAPTRSSPLLSDTSRDDTVRRRASAIQLAADRGARLTRQLLAFSRRQALRPESVESERPLRAACAPPWSTPSASTIG